MSRVTEGLVAAVFGHDEDGLVWEELHRGLHIALLRFHTTQSLNLQNIRYGDKKVFCVRIKCIHPDNLDTLSNAQI